MVGISIEKNAMEIDFELACLKLKTGRKERNDSLYFQHGAVWSCCSHAEVIDIYRP